MCLFLYYLLFLGDLFEGINIDKRPKNAQESTFIYEVTLRIKEK